MQLWKKGLRFAPGRRQRSVSDGSPAGLLIEQMPILPASDVARGSAPSKLTPFSLATCRGAASRLPSAANRSHPFGAQSRSTAQRPGRPGMEPKREVLRELKKIELAWPALNYSTAPGVLILLPSTPVIALLNQGQLGR